MCVHKHMNYTAGSREISDDDWLDKMFSRILVARYASMDCIVRPKWHSSNIILFDDFEYSSLNHKVTQKIHPKTVVFRQELESRTHCTYNSNA